MGEGFAFATWIRLNFPRGFQPPRSRQKALYKFWRTNQRNKWWCWACQSFHVNVG